MDLDEARTALDAAVAALQAVEASLEPETLLPPAESVDLLRRVALVVSRVRRCSVHSRAAVSDDLIHLEESLQAIEAMHAATVDAAMDRRYREHNVPHGPEEAPDPTCGRTEVPAPEPSGPPPAIDGQWGGWGRRKKL